MARHRKIDVGMWGDGKFRSLSKPRPNAQTLWIYLLTGPHTTAAPGLFSEGEAGLAEAIGWSLRAFRSAFFELEKREMVRADWSSRVVWIPRAVNYNPPESPNVVKAWRKAIAEIPECELRDEAIRTLRESCLYPDVFDEPLWVDGRGRTRVGTPKPLPASPKPSPNPSPMPSPKASGSDDTEPSGNDARKPSGFPGSLFPGSLPEGFEESGAGTGTGTEREGSGSSASPGARAPSPRQLLEGWNANRGALPEAKALPPGREKAARARLKTVPDLERWAAAVRRLAALPHLLGQSWVTLDFLLRPDSLTKVEEGRYDRPFRSAASEPPPRPLVGAHPPVPCAAQRPQLPPAPAGGGDWPAVLERLRDVIDERDFETWFKPTRQSGETNGVIRVVVGERFRECAENEYRPVIEDLLRDLGIEAPVEFVVGQ